jgi:hypothetical protein
MFEALQLFFAGHAAIAAVIALLTGFIIWFWLDNSRTHWNIVDKIQLVLDKLHGDHLDLHNKLNNVHVDLIDRIEQKEDKINNRIDEKLR